jgi:putative hemolysin
LEDPQSIGIIVGALVFLLAIITAAICSVSSVRLSALEKLSEEGDKRAQKLFNLLGDHRERVLSGLSIGRLLISLLIGAFIAYRFLLADEIAADTLLLFALISLVVLIFLGEIIPRFIGCLNPEKTAGMLYPVIRVVEVFMFPFSVLGEKISSPLTKTLENGKEKTSGITADEIRHLVNEGHRKGLLEEEEKEMIQSVFEFKDTIAREVMVPRVDIEALEDDSTLNDVVQLMVESGLSRIPIYEETLDKILGIVYSKDLLPHIKGGKLDKKAIDVARKPPFFIPDSKPVVNLLREMQRRSISIAIVVDEYGGTSGLVTIEDLLEEIVGEITDEYDQEEPNIRTEPDGSYLVEGATIIEDVNNFLDIDVPTEDNETIGGFVYGHLGHIPEQGESMMLEELGIDIIVEQIEGQRIQSLRIRKHGEELMPEIQV